MTDDRPIVIVGAGRLGRNIVMALESRGSGGQIAGFLDDTRAPGDRVMDHPILAGFARRDDRQFVAEHRWFVAIGDNRIRSDLSSALADRGAAFVTAFQSTAEAARTAVIGRGVFAGPNVWIGADTAVGDWTVIEGASFLGNDIRVGTAAFLAPAVVLTGGGVRRRPQLPRRRDGRLEPGLGRRRLRRRRSLPGAAPPAGWHDGPWRAGAARAPRPASSQAGRGQGRPAVKAGSPSSASPARM